MIAPCCSPLPLLAPAAAASTTSAETAGWPSTRADPLATVATRGLCAGPATIEIALRGAAPAHALEGMVAAAGSPAGGTAACTTKAAAPGDAGPVACSAAPVREPPAV